MTAADLVNNSTEEELLHILWEYGEEQNARRIVRAILASRPLIHHQAACRDSSKK